MQGVLSRYTQDDEGTFGKLTLDDGFECYTAELPDRDNAHGISCIPSGTYVVERVNSPKHGPGTLQLVGVPGRGNIQIHAGNWAGDKSKGLRSDVEGCILVGQGMGEVMGQMAVTGSRAALQALKAHVGSSSFQLQIVGRIRSEKVT